MKYLVTLKRKETLNATQNARQMRVEVSAGDEQAAKLSALHQNSNGKYFAVESVRKV